MRGRPIAFQRIADAAARHSETILRRWLPDGRIDGHEWIARNPKRADRKPGSFKVNFENDSLGRFRHGGQGRRFDRARGFPVRFGSSEGGAARRRNARGRSL